MARPQKQPKPDGLTRQRKCLMCGAAFASDGAHNRICPSCKLSRTWRDGLGDTASVDWKRRA